MENKIIKMSDFEAELLNKLKKIERALIGIEVMLLIIALLLGAMA